MNVAEDALKTGIIQNNPEAAKVETAEQTPKVATVTNTSTNVDDVKFMGNPTSDEPKGSFVIVNGDVKTNPVEGKNSEITSTDKQIPNEIKTDSTNGSDKVDEKLINELVKDFGHILGEGGIAALKEFITNGGEGSLEKVFMDADGDGLPDYLDKDLKSRAEIARDEMLKLMDRKLFSLNKDVGDMVGTVKKVLSRITGLDESSGGLNAASKSLCKSLGLNVDEDKGNAMRAVAEKSKAEMINMQN